MRGRRPRLWRWWAWWSVGAPLLIVFLVSQTGRAEPVALRGEKAAMTPAKHPRPRPGAGVGHMGHTVRPGDSLWTISRRYGVTVDVLSRVNGIRPGQRLQIGQRLTIPVAVADAGRQEPPSLAEIVLGPPPEANRAMMAWPLTAPVASGFGPRGVTWHGGIDLRADRGTPIRAAAPGMVIMSGTENGYGRVVKIWHALDLMTVYAHNHENYVRVGEWVELGQVIGTVGSTGRTTAPHLHFEVRLDGRKYNPLFWMPEPGVVEVAASDLLENRAIR